MLACGNGVEGNLFMRVGGSDDIDCVERVHIQHLVMIREAGWNIPCFLKISEFFTVATHRSYNLDVVELKKLFHVGLCKSTCTNNSDTNFTCF